MEVSQVPKYVMSTLCRICAEKSPTLTPIFQDESLPVKIYKCLPIEVKESDCLPLNVCETCCTKINDSYSLYRKADEADQRLKKLWEILIKETMTDISHHQQEAVVQQNESESSVAVPNENQGNPLHIIEVPDELQYQSVEIPNNVQFLNEMPSEILIINAVDSYEVINDNFLLKSIEKSMLQSDVENIQPNIVFESEERSEEENHGENFFQCQVCPQQFSSFGGLKSHESTHSEDKPFLCDTCGKAFRSAKNLKIHNRIHSGIRKNFICKICNKAYLTNFFLQEHMNSHTGDKPYKCLVCGKEFREKIHLRQHKWTHLNQKFVCSSCGSKFNRKGNMTEHMKHCQKKGTQVKSKANQKAKEENPSNLICPNCNCEFASINLLKSHLKIHTEVKRFSCSICGKKFRHSGSMTYHRRVAHTGERPFQCNFCEEKFSLRSVQIIHERKTHTFEQPYKCSLCSRQFFNSSTLKNHMSVHAKDKLFGCEECGKRFSRRSNLLVHRKLHTGERKFVCDQCGKKYIQKHDLLKHSKVHDPKSKPFFCKYCGNSFSNKKDTVKHAMCQFDFLRKSNTEFHTAEKILESVTNDLDKAERHFSIEEEEQIILGSVEEFSCVKENIYGL